jgi:hypothetical protein
MLNFIELDGYFGYDDKTKLGNLRIIIENCRTHLTETANELIDHARQLTEPTDDH